MTTGKDQPMRNNWLGVDADDLATLIAERASARRQLRECEAAATHAANQWEEETQRLGTQLGAFRRGVARALRLPTPVEQENSELVQMVADVMAAVVAHDAAPDVPVHQHQFKHGDEVTWGGQDGGPVHVGTVCNIDISMVARGGGHWALIELPDGTHAQLHTTDLRPFKTFPVEVPAGAVVLDRDAAGEIVGTLAGLQDVSVTLNGTFEPASREAIDSAVAANTAFALELSEQAAYETELATGDDQGPGWKITAHKQVVVEPVPLPGSTQYFTNQLMTDVIRPMFADGVRRAEFDPGPPTEAMPPIVEPRVFNVGDECPDDLVAVFDNDNDGDGDPWDREQDARNSWVCVGDDRTGGGAVSWVWLLETYGPVTERLVDHDA